MAWIVLSLVQGLTEFLPVSSSGHLVLTKKILGFTESGLEMELWLHAATLVALSLFFWKDISVLTVGVFKKGNSAADAKWPGFIILSTAITGIIGVSGRKFFVETFDNPVLLAWGFIVSAVLILATRLTRESRDRLTWADAALFGLAQAAAILPSISRSGTTIALLLFLGIDRATAFRYSFIASIPAILAAFLLEVKVGSFAIFTPATLAISFAVTGSAGFVTLMLLKRFVIRRQFYLFGWYCLAMGILSFFWVK